MRNVNLEIDGRREASDVGDAEVAVWDSFERNRVSGSGRLVGDLGAVIFGKVWWLWSRYRKVKCWT